MTRQSGDELDNESAVTLSGTVEGVVYSNEDNGYTVADLDCNGELVTIVGVLGDVREGESLTLIGEYVNSPKYGRQFEAEVCERALRNTESAVRRRRSGDGEAYRHGVRQQCAGGHRKRPGAAFFHQGNIH